MTLIFWLVAFVAFLYFGYKDDYYRDKSRFKTTIVVIIGSIIIIFYSFKFNTLSETFIKNKLQAYYTTQLGWDKDIEKFNKDYFTTDKGLQELQERDNILSKKIAPIISIWNFIHLILTYLLVTQFHKSVKRFFNKPEN